MRGDVSRVGARQSKQDRVHMVVKTFVRIESESARITDQENGGVSTKPYFHADWAKVSALQQDTVRVPGIRGVREIRDSERARSKLEVGNHRNVGEQVHGGEPP
eukprot:972922-Pleurochrysis_carterae.AAC.2